MLEITSQTQLEEIKTSSNIFFLYFYADWCQPCKIVMPKIEQLEKEYEKIQFAKVNIDKNKRICEDYQVDVIPSMIMLKNDKTISQINKITGINEIKTIITNMQNKSNLG